MEETKLKKKFGLLIALVMAISLCLIPSAAMAEDVTLELGVYTNVFDLENKDVAWEAKTGDGIGAQFGYNAGGSTFDFGLIAEGLAVSTPYSLIYYADTEDRFVDWGGLVGAAGRVIASGTSGADGSLVLSGSPELNQNLPSLPDANAYFYDYTLPPDGYADATGAKIWLIPTAVLTGGVMPVATWSPDDTWLFEMQLVNYSDDEKPPERMVAITVSPTVLNFGLSAPNVVVSRDLTVTNTGFVDVDVTATATGAISGMSMTLNTTPIASWAGVSILATEPDSTAAVTVGITTPATPGVYTGILTFTATATP